MQKEALTCSHSSRMDLLLTVLVVGQIFMQWIKCPILDSWELLCVTYMDNNKKF